MEGHTDFRIYRFRDQVALSVGEGETLYLTPERAWKLSLALADYAQDCRSVEFVDSPLASYDSTEDKTLSGKES